MKEIIELLTKNEETISTMESCTGGGIANAITNVPGASEVFKYGAVTYANEFKIKMGINKETIEKYTVYSQEVADEMSKKITEFTEVISSIIDTTTEMITNSINVTNV